MSTSSATTISPALIIGAAIVGIIAWAIYGSSVLLLLLLAGGIGIYFYNKRGTESLPPDKLATLENRIARLEAALLKTTPTPAAAPPVTLATAPPPTARLTPPPSFAASRPPISTPAPAIPFTPVAAPTPQPQHAEFEIGQKWLSVVGVVLLFLAAFFFVRYLYDFLGPPGKIMISYLGAAVLFGIGFFTTKKYPLFSGVINAGAWGITYLTTYAAHFFAATRIIVSPSLALFLLSLVVGALLTLALYQKSRPLVAGALFLGYLTLILSPLSLFSILGTLVLLGAFITLAEKMSWPELALPATFGAYIAYIFWLTNVAGQLPAEGGGLVEKHTLAILILVAMWSITALSTVRQKQVTRVFGLPTDTTVVAIAFLGSVSLALHSLTTLAPTTGASFPLAYALQLTIFLMGLFQLLLAAYKQSRAFLIIGLGAFFIIIFSPYTLSPLIGLIILFAITGFAAVRLSWSNFVLPTTIAAYITYIIWVATAANELTGTTLSSQHIYSSALAGLVSLWIIASVWLLRRPAQVQRPATALVDSATSFITTVAAAFFGAGHVTALLPSDARLATAVWFLLFAGLCAGVTLLARGYQKSIAASVTNGLLSLFLLMGSIAAFLPAESASLSTAWAVLALIIAAVGVSRRSPHIAAVAILPFIASTLYYFFNTIHDPSLIGTTALSFRLLAGLTNAIALLIGAALLRAVHLAAPPTPDDATSEHVSRMGSALLALAVLVLLSVSHYEFTAATPSVIWSMVGLAIVAVGFLSHWKDSRLIGLATLAITVVRVFLLDLRDLEPLPRVISFAILGGLLVLLGYVYNRYKDTIAELIEE